MLEQTCVPLRGGRFQSESLVAPVKKTSNRIIYLIEKPSSNALQKYGKAPDTSKTDLLNTSAGYDINSVIAELEKRRAKLLGLARAAEARAREVEEEFEQFRSRLHQETKQRLVAEQKLRDFKEDRLRLLGAEAGAHEDKEGELRNTEERHRQQENGPKNFILYGTVITLLVGACWLLIAASL